VIKRTLKVPLKGSFKAFFVTYRLQTFVLLGLIILLSLFFPSGKSLQYAYQLNDIARDPVIAPFTFPILKTEEKLQADLEEARRSKPFLFIRSQAVVDSGIARIENFFSKVRAIQGATLALEESRDLVYRYRYEEEFQERFAKYRVDSTALVFLMESFDSQVTFDISEQSWSDFIAQGLSSNLENQIKVDLVQICRNRWAEGILDIPSENITSDEVLVSQGEDGAATVAKPDDFNDLETAWTKARIEITNLYSDENDPRLELSYDLIIEFMQPNLIFDKETTDRRLAAHLDRVPRYQGTVLENERIVDKNTRITQDILQKLNSLAAETSKQEGFEEWWVKILAYAGRMVIIGVVLSFFFTFLLIYRIQIYKNWRMVLLISLIFAVELGLANLFVVQFKFSEYLIPITVAAMTLTILFDARIGFMGTTALVILISILLGNDVDFIIVSLFTSSVAMYNVRQLRTRSQLFITIFSLIGASILVLIGLGLFKHVGWEAFQQDLVFLVVVSVLAPIITYGLVGLIEIGFEITTDLSLLELLDFDHPLLKRLQQEANGTFNHCVVVGNLAEFCAYAIGARSLLCRVGAYYHDIGKIIRPEYFIENQFTNKSKHDTLTRIMSAKIIKNHIKEGLQLAEEYAVPKIVSDFIPMHHGTSLVEYFYRVALEEAKDPSKVDETAFRYSGPKPNTKETGILMICEAVEAAVRSLQDRDMMKIEDMIDKIIKNRVDDGQLDECPLTLDELRRIKGTVDGSSGMLPVLRGIYHIRIEYPEVSQKPESTSAPATAPKPKPSSTAAQASTSGHKKNPAK
jgi:putative nucleotidyltransferase with HDIG domain